MRDAIEFRKLRDHVGVMFASKNINDAEMAHLSIMLQYMTAILHGNGYEINVGRETDYALDFGDDGGWKGYL